MSDEIESEVFRPPRSFPRCPLSKGFLPRRLIVVGAVHDPKRTFPVATLVRLPTPFVTPGDRLNMLPCRY
jgi:hypothetical protein